MLLYRTQVIYAYVGQHQKLTESDFSLNLTQMGARVYLASLGRFAQVDPVEGGTDNAYAYANDPVNDFDLDGTFSIKKAFGKVALVASIASVIPGPIGMVAAGISAASYAAAGDGRNAAIMAGTIALAAVGAGAVGLTAKVAIKSAPAVKAVTKIAPYSKYTGINSKLFGSGGSYRKVGTVRKGILNNNNLLRIGWQGNKTTNLAFRISIGPSPKYAGKASKINPIKYIQHKHPLKRNWPWR